MKKAIKYVYVAAPYNSNPVHNSSLAMDYANWLVDYGFTPIIPHVHMLWNIHTPRAEEFWYKYTLDLMRICDAVVRFPGESMGADEEVRVAKEIGIPVFLSLNELVHYNRP